MQINLTFESLHELREYCELTLRGMAPRDSIKSEPQGVIAEPVPETTSSPESVSYPECVAQETAISESPWPVRRKRRTKADIEAEKAAQDQGATVVATEAPVVATAPQATPLDNLKSESETPVVHHTSHNDQTRAEIATMAALYDGTSPDAKLAHLSEGRDFIAKHGFLTYNETMTLADVPPNISTHTPEQASLHRAAMAWKAAQLAKG